MLEQKEHWPFWISGYSVNEDCLINHNHTSRRAKIRVKENILNYIIQNRLSQPQIEYGTLVFKQPLILHSYNKYNHE